MYSAILRSIKLAELFLRVFVCQKPTDLKRLQRIVCTDGAYKNLVL